MKRIIKILINIGWLCCPPIIWRKIQARAESKKTDYYARCYRTKVRKEEIYSLFDKLAIDSDVIIHTSFPEIGNIEGKCQYVAECLQQVVDRGHTLLFPALPIKGSSMEFLKSHSELEMSTMPNAMGILSKYYGRQAGSRRSMQPTHSVIAYGPQAEYYTNEHHLDETPFTEKSPYYKLLKNGGKVLMFGAGLKHLTICHVVEDMLGKDYPVNVYTKPYSVQIQSNNTIIHKGFYRAHSHIRGILSDGSHVVSKTFLQLPSTQVYNLGCGEVVLLDVREMIICQLELLKMGVTTMCKLPISSAAKIKADMWISKIQNDNL